MSLNTMLSSIVSAPVKAPAQTGPGTGTPGGGDPLDVDLFRVALAAQIAPPTTSPKAAPGAAQIGTDAGSSTQAALQAKIQKMIEAGASQSEVIAALSNSLATTAAQQLNVTAGDARRKLQAMFATALAPPGEADGSSGSAADRARILAQRAMKLLDLAESITGTSSGQQKRLSGTISDATPAKDHPALAKTGTTSPALKSHVAQVPIQAVPADFALPTAAQLSAAAAAAVATVSANTIGTASAETAKAAASAKASVAATMASPAVVAPRSLPSATATASSAAAAVSAELSAAASTHAGLSSRTVTPPGVGGSADGKTVALGSTAAVAGDGDTTLGRILTRASLAADARQAAAAKSATSPAATSTATSDSAAAAPSGSAVAPDPSADATVSAFMKSFAAALRDSGAAASTPTTPSQHNAAQPAALPLPAANSAASAAFMPAPAPFRIEQASAATPAATLTPPTPVDQSSIADQVLRGAFMNASGKSSEIRLSLVPETLGDVSVKLTVDAGNVSAHVVADTPEVRDAIISAQPELSRSLADAGLKLTSFTVDVSGGGFAGFAQQQQNDGAQSRQRSNRGTSAIDLDADEDTAVDAVPSFGPPIDAAPNPGDLNHLA